jgi:hypothetical protein
VLLDDQCMNIQNQNLKVKHPCEPMDGYKQVHVWMDVQISLCMNEVKRLKYLNMATRLPPCPRPLILVMPPLGLK